MRRAYEFLDVIKENLEGKWVNIGCGKDIKSGYINLDWTTECGADIACDLSLGKLPFNDNEIAHIYCSHCLEHLNNWKTIVDEMYRVCKNKAYIHIKVPYYNCQNAFYPEHVAFFSSAAFDPWTMNKDNPEKLTKKGRFRMVMRSPSKAVLFVAQYIPEYVQEIEFVLEVVKLE